MFYINKIFLDQQLTALKDVICTENYMLSCQNLCYKISSFVYNCFFSLVKEHKTKKLNKSKNQNFYFKNIITQKRKEIIVYRSKKIYYVTSSIMNLKLC